MGDIEDRFLKHNVPGRWSSFENHEDARNEDDDHSKHIAEMTYNDNDEPPLTEEEILIEKARNMSQEDVPEPIRRKILAERMGKHKTGVKGVLADYLAHEKLKEAQAIATKAHREAVLRRIAEGCRIQPIHNSLSNQALVIEDDEDEDDEFFEEFRQRRLQELKMETNLPTYGSCREVDSADFLEEVEAADPRTVVVVHLYEPSILTCTRVNRFLEEIALTHRHVKFLRMKASSNQIEVDRVTLPILTFYKGGDTVSVLAGIGHELGEFFTRDELEWLLDDTLQSIHR